ncbi:hypothetical protein [Marinobacter pelagius]|uniref:Uncharacterized protein n=1 Tax=Marinobacter pelagius TaxID=379482 RepID=A0A1I4T400_9GAMM|nr:hypothetical protein [Marinobacter pelagius]SFM71357.1 hypothetical protein SAMN04487961_0985 [Marinobacter pelagius]
MKSKVSAIIESVIQKVSGITAGSGYVNTVSKVEGGQRNFDENELEAGVCLCVAYAGTELASKSNGAPQQVSSLSLVIEAHKLNSANTDIQAEGLDLLADIEKAVLGKTDYLNQSYVMPRGILNESETVEISEDGNAIVATSIVTIPFIKQYANPHEE